MTDLTICPREGCTATERHWHDDPTKWPCSFLPGPCEHAESSDDPVACHEPRPQADLTEPVDPRVERVAQALYEAGRDSTLPGWQDVTDKTRGKHLKLARAAVAAIDEAVESDD